MQEKKRPPLLSMRLDWFFLKVYIDQGGMLPTKPLASKSFTPITSVRDQLNLSCQGFRGLLVFEEAR